MCNFNAMKYTDTQRLDWIMSHEDGDVVLEMVNRRMIDEYMESEGQEPYPEDEKLVGQVETDETIINEYTLNPFTYPQIEINPIKSELLAMAERHSKILRAIQALSDTMDAHDWDGGDCDSLHQGCDCIELRMDDLKKFLKPDSKK
jgi:hypothetical protein